MANYYFLGSSLPGLQMGEQPELSLREFETLLRDNLSDADWQKCMALRRLYDLLNMRSLWMRDELDSLGLLSESELDEALLTGEGLPPYAVDYLDRHEDDESRLRYFPTLLQAYYEWEGESASGFLQDYLLLERELRLVLLGFRAKRLGRDLVAELQFEDAGDDLVAQLLAQKDVPHYEPPYRYEDLKSVFERHQADPLALHQALCTYRFEKVAQMTEGSVFSIDAVLAYMVQLILAERWIELDAAKGKQVLDALV
jgi:hypothetical protein